MMDYSDEFFRDAAKGSRLGAEAVLGLVLETFVPKRAVDVGCGLGIWLKVLSERGVQISGVDGGFVDSTHLVIPPTQFVIHDLEQTLPALVGFDLAISMETAEHLSPGRADSFISELCQLAPLVLFSAAAPEQGGTHHLNEQWPEYWVEKFGLNGFRSIDCIRPRIWHNEGIPYWYKQNAFLAVRQSYLDATPALRELAARYPAPFAMVHPQHFLEKVRSLRHASDIANHGLARVFRALPGMIAGFSLRRWRTTWGS